MEQAEFSEETKEFAHKLFHGECEFVAGTTTEERIPATTLPEVAFAGRSNVGKSSLLNALTSRTKLARTSHTPGRTQQLNFFSIRDQLMITDLPGYGYAKTSRSKVNQWTSLTEKYLAGRTQLRRVLLLLDSRRGEVRPHDEEIMDLLDEAAVIYQITLTKSDKTSQEDTDKFIKYLSQIQEKHTAMHPEVLITSSRKKSGLDTLRCSLAEIVL